MNNRGYGRNGISDTAFYLVLVLILAVIAVLVGTAKLSNAMGREKLDRIYKTVFYGERLIFEMSATGGGATEEREFIVWQAGGGEDFICSMVPIKRIRMRNREGWTRPTVSFSLNYSDTRSSDPNDIIKSNLNYATITCRPEDFNLRAFRSAEGR